MAFPYAWHSTNEGEWKREAMGFEKFVLSVPKGSDPRFNIIVSILTKLQQPMDKESLSSTLRSAWLSTLYQVPNLTFLPVLGKDNKYYLSYSQKPSSEEANKWLANTLTEEILTDVQNPSQALDEQGPIISQQQPHWEVGSNAFLWVYYFMSGSKVTDVGFICCANHAAFDGTGIYTCLSNFLENTVVSVGGAATHKQIKAAPEKTVLECIPPEILQANHMGLVQEIAQGFALPAQSHSVSRASPSPQEQVRFREARHTFSSSETAQILSKTKNLNITISQLAMAAYVVCVLEKYPAEKLSKFAYASVFNTRNAANIPSPYYGNAINGTFDQFRGSDLNEATLQGKLSNSQDAQAVVNLAKVLTSNVKRNGQDTLAKVTAMNQTIEMIVPTLDPNSAPAPFSMGYVADGILERYIQRQYSGDRLSIEVKDVHLTLQDPAPIVQGRTSTFRECLTLTLSFDTRSWPREEVEGMVNQWAKNLLFTLEHAGVPNQLEH